jgi:RND family efflux transporter MFP subunit
MTARLAALALPLALLAACGGAESTPDTPATSATAERTISLVAADLVAAESGDLTTGVLLTGMLEPATSVTISAQVPGTVAELLVDRGSVVAQGARLATLQADGVRANVAAAEANVAVARTRRDASRRLFDAGAISKIDLENSEAAYAAAEAQAAAARESAGFTDVQSPIAGTVSDRRVESGTAVRVGDAMFTIVSTTELELAGRVPVDEAGAINVGQEVRFAIDAFAGRTFTGRVARKDPIADAATRQVGVYVRVANPRGEITAGQYARGDVAGRTVRDAVRVPETAVLGSGNEAAVFVFTDGRLQRRQVTVVARSAREGVVAIGTGLSAGERVLLRPTPGLADGQRAVVGEER